MRASIALHSILAFAISTPACTAEDDSAPAGTGTTDASTSSPSTSGVTDDPATTDAPTSDPSEGTDAEESSGGTSEGSSTSASTTGPGESSGGDESTGAGETGPVDCEACVADATIGACADAQTMCDQDVYCGLVAGCCISNAAECEMGGCGCADFPESAENWAAVVACLADQCAGCEPAACG